MAEKEVLLMLFSDVFFSQLILYPYAAWVLDVMMFFDSYKSQSYILLATVSVAGVAGCFVNYYIGVILARYFLADQLRAIGMTNQAGADAKFHGSGGVIFSPTRDGWRYMHILQYLVIFSAVAFIGPLFSVLAGLIQADKRLFLFLSSVSVVICAANSLFY